MSTSASLVELLASCGLENRIKLFEDEGYTLEIAIKAVRDDQTTLLDDLRELKLPMDECRKFMEALAAADNAGKSSNQPQPEPQPVATAAVAIGLPMEPVAIVPQPVILGPPSSPPPVILGPPSSPPPVLLGPPSSPPPSVAIGPPQPNAFGPLPPGWTGTPGDRHTQHAGATKLSTPTMIRISDWELKGPGCCDHLCLALRCSWWDNARSYLYIRDNSSIEKNDTNGINNCCSCCSKVKDYVSVEYNDRAPYAKTCKRSPFPCCCMFNCDQPKLEVVNLGFMCCCMKCDTCCCCCESKQVVIMPFESLPFPCCCCSNRVGCCDNCCGLCGPITGNPKVFSLFGPQPKHADAFVAAGQQVMQRG